MGLLLEPTEPRLDFAFTADDAPRARARIEADLRKIVATVQRADPRLDALILTGGFSRGEGTVREGRPVNDYDLVAVRRAPGGDASYRELGQSLGGEVGIEVDLLPIARARLPFVGRKLFWLDARLGARVIHGPEEVLDKLPRMSAQDLPPIESARLLGNRAAGLLLAVPTATDPQPVLQRDLQATKAALAAMDASLLHQGRYAPRMRDRLALLDGHPDHATFAKAVAWKLAPDAADMGSSWWRECRDALLRAVDATGARAVRDGPVEHAVALLQGRVHLHPSRRVRHEAWTLLTKCDWPRGPAEWETLKPSFFAARARTLQ